MRVFLLVFFLVYGGAHLYAFLKTRGAFALGWKSGVPLALFMAFMVLAPIIVWFSESRGHETIARVVSYAGYVWLGVLFLFITASLAMDAWRIGAHLAGLASGAGLARYALSSRTAFLVAISFSLLLNFYGYFEARDIRTERVVVRSPKISGRLKIAQISDVHLGLIVRQKRLEAILGLVRAESPDILVSTGDLVDGQINRLPGLSDMLGQIRPPLGKYAITGNHEYYAGLRQALSFIEGAGFRVLRDEGLTVGDEINIVGVDDPTGRAIGDESALIKPGGEQEALGSVPRDKFTLLLKHRPYFDGRSTGLFDLQLSGHTHKGQIFPFIFIVRIPYPKIAGSYDLPGGAMLYVSRGTGTWGPPVRVLSPPEVTIIEIVGEEPGQKQERTSGTDRPALADG